MNQDFDLNYRSYCTNKEVWPLLVVLAYSEKENDPDTDEMMQNYKKRMLSQGAQFHFQHDFLISRAQEFLKYLKGGERLRKLVHVSDNDLAQFKEDLQKRRQEHEIRMNEANK
jgi:hypothetical protein